MPLVTTLGLQIVASTIGARLYHRALCDVKLPQVELNFAMTFPVPLAALPKSPLSFCNQIDMALTILILPKGCWSLFIKVRYLLQRVFLIYHGRVR
jgi:hypothetical protein